MQLKFLLMPAAVAVTLVASPVAAQNLPPVPPTNDVPATNATLTARQFVDKAATGGEYEIRAAQIAERRSRNRQIEHFAQRMIRDHSRNDAQLKTVVERIGGLRVPTHLDSTHLGLIKQLQAVGARQFDTVYSQQQVQAHQNAVALFTAYERFGENGRLKQFARGTLPMLRAHLALARALPAGPQVAGNK
jgi:putative membrane protein